jgi:O-antigen/teichoic acid export membrane protein
MVSAGRRLIYGSGLRTFVLGMNILVSLFLIPYLIHGLGDRWYGMWAVVLNVVSYLQMMDFGFTTATRRYVAHAYASGRREDVVRVVSQSVVLFTLIGGAIAAGSLAVAASAPRFFPEPAEASVFRSVVLLQGTQLALAMPLSVYAAVFEAKLRYDLLSYAELVTMVVRTAAMIAVVEADLSIVGVAIVSSGAETLRLLALTLVARRAFDVRVDLRHIDVAGLRGIGIYSADMTVIQVGDVLRSNVDNLVIAPRLGLEAVTPYSVASRVVQYGLQVMTSVFGTLLAPLTGMHARGDTTALRRAVVVTSDLSAAAGFLVFGLLVVAAEDLVTLWIGPSHREAALPLMILAGAFACASPQRPGVSLLFASGQHRIYAFSHLAEGAANLALSLALVGRLGLVGVALGTAIPMLVSKLLIQPFIVARVSPLGVGEYYAMFARAAGVAAVPLGLFWYWLRCVEPGSLPVLAGMMLGHAVLHAVLVLRAGLLQETRASLYAACPGLLRGAFRRIAGNPVDLGGSGG